MATPPDNTQKFIGHGFVGVAALFLATQMPPANGFLKLDWPAYCYYLIIGVCGALAGYFEVRERVLGMISGAIVGCGSLFAVAQIFPGQWRISTHYVMIALVLGAVPGVAFYYLVKELFGYGEAETPSTEPEPSWMGDAAGRRRRLRIMVGVLCIGAAVIALIMISR